MAHDHNCFEAAQRSAEKMEGRVGHFLFVGNLKKEDAHFLGNTAFGGVVFMSLVANVADKHVSEGCAHCDAVAMALKAARATFRSVMLASPGDC